jgi:hypothetical protein
VFLESGEKEKFTIPLPPIVSDPIYDKKAMSDLIISKLSHCSAPASGGKEVILLCDRVTKDDIQVRFFEERGDQLVWEAYGEFQPADVHKQVAICFRTPRYFSTDIVQSVTVQVQLRRPSDGHTSEPRSFQFAPNAAIDCMSEPQFGRKRAKVDQLQSISRYYRDQGAYGTQQAPSSSGAALNECRVPRMNSPITCQSSMGSSSPSSVSPGQQRPQTLESAIGAPMQGSPALHLHNSHDPTDTFFGSNTPNASESFGYTPMFGKLAIKLEQNVDMSYYPQPTLGMGSQLSGQSTQQTGQASAQQTQSQQQPPQLAPSSVYGGRSSFQATALSPIGGCVDSSLSPCTLSGVTNLRSTSSQHNSNHHGLIGSGMSPAMATGNALSPSMSGAQLCRTSAGNATALHCQSPALGEAEQRITERMDSLDLDIDASDLISDINFNNMMVMMDSGNNITFNSSGNIKLEPGLDALLGSTGNSASNNGINQNDTSNDATTHDSFGMLGNLRMTHRQ